MKTCYWCQKEVSYPCSKEEAENCPNILTQYPMKHKNLEEKIKSEGITPNIPLSEWVKLEGRDKIILSRIETQSNPR